MRRVNLVDLRGNEVLGKDICDSAGRILLSRGVQLNSSFVKKLELVGIDWIFIEDDISRDVVIEDPVTDETRQALKKGISSVIEKMLSGQGADYSGIIQTMTYVMEDVTSRKEVMIMANDIRTKEDMIFAHSSNVCAMSVLVGLKIGMDMDTIKELAVGALLHDFGKVEILKDQDLMPHELEAMYVKHPRFGYEYLERETNFSAVVKACVLMHHEMCDGSGFPLGIKGDEIHPAAKIVAICNTFDNFVYGSLKNKPMPIQSAIEYLTNMTHLYDAELVHNFISIVAVYPNGATVTLNTGEKAIVIRQNKGMPTRPVLRVIQEKDGRLTREIREVDLMKNLSIFILA